MTEEKELYGYEEEDIITLEFDVMVLKRSVEFLGVFDCDDKEYIALNPLERKMFIYGYKEYEEDYELVDITDDAEFEKAVEEFEKLAVEEA